MDRNTLFAVGASLALVPVLGVLGLGVAWIGAFGAVNVAPAGSLHSRQVAEGWAVGEPPGALDLVSDCAVPEVPAGALETLAADLQPGERWAAWNRPTLLEAPAARPPPGSPIRPLAEVLRPLCTTDMRVAYARGRSLAELLAGLPGDTALVVDLAGPEAVALAAALAAAHEPVWTFETWPHPEGAVPAHLTLGAILTYRRALSDAAAARPPGAPPMFVLDSARATSSFPEYDNGYAVELPDGASLRSAGIARVLLVRGRGSDGAARDLRVALGGLHWTDQIPVQLVALQDFQPTSVPELPDDPGALTWWWGGSTESHWAFRAHYGLPDGGRPAVAPPAVGLPWIPERPQVRR